ncbi:hypothetical protein D9M71_648140 [compost metagenome]
MRVALHRIQNEHFVAGHSVHMRGHGLVGPFSIEVVERPYLARTGIPHDNHPWFARNFEPVCTQLRADAAQDDHTVQITDRQIALNALCCFLALGGGKNTGGENEQVQGFHR